VTEAAEAAAEVVTEIAAEEAAVVAETGAEIATAVAATEAEIATGVQSAAQSASRTVDRAKSARPKGTAATRQPTSTSRLARPKFRTSFRARSARVTTKR